MNENKEKYNYAKFDQHVICEVVEYLKQSGLVIWLDHGSLLGLHRDGKLIEWDMDVDIGALEIPTSKKINISRYFYSRYGSGNYDSLNNSLKIYLLDPDTKQPWSIDISFYKQEEGTLIKHWVVKESRGLTFRMVNLIAELLGGVRIRNSNYKLVNFLFKNFTFLFSPEASVRLYETQRKRIKFLENRVDARYIFPLKSSSFYGADLPRSVNEYLSFRYGKDWKTPKRDWNYLKDDGGVVNASEN